MSSAITGVWLSPDGEQIAVQMFGEEIFLIDTTWIGERPQPVDLVPEDWQPLYESSES